MPAVGVFRIHIGFGEYRIVEIAGVFTVEDPDFSANHLWAAALGTMHLARSGVRVSRTPDGVPNAAPVDDAVVRAAAVRAARAIATAL